MTEYRVRFQPIADLTVTVQAEDEESALEEVYDHMPYLCHQCAGHGRKYSLDVPFDDLEAYEVVDAEGNAVWSSKTYIEQMQEQIAALQAKLKALEAKP